MDHTSQPDQSKPYSSRLKSVLAGFLTVAAFFLWTEHRAHLLGILPYLLALACPLMHLFHHGHGHGRRTSNSAAKPGNEKPFEQNPGDKP